MLGNGSYSMRVMIIRHGKVLHDWKKWCTSAEFDEQCALYDKAPIDKASVDKVNDDIQKIYISDLDRTLQTAEKIFGEEDFNRTALLNEVPLHSGFDIAIRLPLGVWNVLGRLQWLIGSKRQPEGRKQTTMRAERFVALIISQNEDCAVVTHGFFMHSLIKALERKGFKADNNHLSYSNCEVIKLTRE